MPDPPRPDVVPGILLERLVHPDPQRVDAALQGLQVLLEQQRQELSLRPLPSGNPALALTSPQVRAWNWGAFLAGPLWAMAHGMTLLGVLLLVFYFLFPLPNLLLGYFGGQMGWTQRPFSGVEDFTRVQRAWALGGLVVFPLQMALLVATILSLF